MLLVHHASLNGRAAVTSAAAVSLMLVSFVCMAAVLALDRVEHNDDFARDQH